MATWLEQERAATVQQQAQHAGRPTIAVTSSYLPSREGNRPYRIETVDGVKPRQRYYESYREMFDAIEQANPGKVAKEA